MTYRDMPSRELEGGATVDELLLEAGLSDDADMRAALLSLRALGNVPAPAPGPELAVMLGGPHDQLSKRRWQRKHRTALAGVAVIAAMGLGVSGVAAASSGFTKTPTIISGLFGNLPQHDNTTPKAVPGADAPRGVTEPAPAEANTEPAPAEVKVPDERPAENPTTNSPTPRPTETKPTETQPPANGQAPAEQAQGTVPGSKDLPSVANQAAKEAENAKPGQGSTTGREGVPANPFGGRRPQTSELGEAAKTMPGKALGFGDAKLWANPSQLLRQAPAVLRK